MNKILCLLLVLSSAMLAAAGDDKWKEIRECILEKDPDYFNRLDRDYKPPPKPTLQDVLGTNVDILVPMLTNIVAQVSDLQSRVWSMNGPISNQITAMLRWSIRAAVGETLAWMETTNGAAYLADTNEYGKWARSISVSRDIVDKVEADKRGWVTSINWPVVYTNCPEIDESR